MTCENNKKGCNNKFLISTWMLASMVCILSVSDMFGMEKPKGAPLDPYDVMKKIEENPEAFKSFKAIFKGHEDLMKRNCCCGGIDIAKTLLPKDPSDGEKSDIFLGTYISSRFILNEEKGVIINDEFDKTNAKCGTFDNIVQSVYVKSE